MLTGCVLPTQSRPGVWDVPPRVGTFTAGFSGDLYLWRGVRASTRDPGGMQTLSPSPVSSEGLEGLPSEKDPETSRIFEGRACRGGGGGGSV